MSPRVNKMGARSAKSYDDAKELSEKWHGRPSRGDKTVTQTIKYSKNVVDLGELELLGVLKGELPETDENGEDINVEEIEEENWEEYDDIEPIDFPEGVILSSNASGNQLLVLTEDFINLNLSEADWISERELAKDKVNLGYVFAVGYFTDKHHLEGPETQKNGTSYIHQFGAKTGIRPCLIYDQVNGSIELVGGDYVVEDIGIVG